MAVLIPLKYGTLGDMMVRKMTLELWGAFILLAFVISPQIVRAGPIRIGSVHDEPAKEIKKFLPIARYLAKALKSDGIDGEKVVVASSISHMSSLIREGKVDLYIDSPFPSLAVRRLAGSEFLLRRWKKGKKEYHTVIFVRKDSGIKRLEQLKGKVIAFESPYSTSGYFLPKMVLAQKGFKPLPQKGAIGDIPSDQVGYVFSRDDENTVVWVLRGKVTAGAMDHRNYLKDAKKSLNQLQILHKTFPVPRQIVSYRPDLPPQLVVRIKAILMGMDASEEGRQALKAFEKTTKFDEIPEHSLAPITAFSNFFDKEFK